MELKSAAEIWETALGELQIQISKPNFETWLKDTVGLSYHNNWFTIGVPNAFIGEWLNNRLRSLIIKTLVSIIGKDTNIQFSVYSREQAITASLPTSQTDGGLTTLVMETVTSSRFNPRFTFDTFIVGNCNRLAYLAALGVTEKVPNDYNPLFIYGGTGLGKTHLLHAIGHKAIDKGFRTLYVTAEQFTNELIRAIKERRAEHFHNKFRNNQVFLVDGIHFISGKGQVQESFLHTFNELYHANAQIVVTSDCPPKAIPLLDPRLRSRFEWGLIADILPPEMETRLAILQAKASERGLTIQPEILRFLAVKVQGSIRELEGALNRVAAYTRLNKVNLDISSASEALANIGAADTQGTAPLKLMIEVVANYFGLSPEVLRGDKRNRKTSLARQIAMYLMREEGRCTLNQISREFGNRDHTTILYGCGRIAKQLKTDPKLRAQLADIQQTLKFSTNKTRSFQPKLK